MRLSCSVPASAVTLVYTAEFICKLSCLNVPNNQETDCIKHLKNNSKKKEKILLLVCNILGVLLNDDSIFELNAI